MAAGGGVEEFDAMPRNNSDDTHFRRGKATRPRIHFLRVPSADDAVVHHHKGALVVMDDRIISARDAQKMYARTGGFAAPEMGIVGVVARHGVEFFYTSTRRHTSTSEFDIRDVTTLPRVDIQYSYA